jgi:Holliday junction DNA helicase RuvA
MISFVRGKPVETSPTSVVVEINNFGVEVLIPLSTYEKLADKEEVILLTHLYVREDALTLYGFASAEERTLFQDLLSISGIGPRLALGILSSCKVLDFYKYIASGDEHALVRIKGLGKKTAQRVLIDLKEKALAKAEHISISEQKTAMDSTTVEEAMLAMMSLGFSRNEAEQALARAASGMDQNCSVEDLLKAALSR